MGTGRTSLCGAPPYQVRPAALPATALALRGFNSSASAERMQTNQEPWRADFTRDIALNYVKRGYHLLCRHAVTLLLMPVAATVLVRFPRNCMQVLNCQAHVLAAQSQVENLLCSAGEQCLSASACMACEDMRTNSHSQRVTRERVRSSSWATW